ncbi:ABC-type Fe3+-hydroxamate transport system, periplasmic component [Candidatus Nitrososphaera evergladensis SR1]|uniref:ABC-type Fe3+-hydroxamate transport system, periplasmic component n=1 Tax=Candidatus Nitrososphaera evergladensis SR1 TaxID=1459636 RepID=A0A075MW74_9ARCH|nr:cobalamin-binding protein [Candidatus Nitrososphaera evergladensis]AIF84892.1 ABC-type Fe3+-hydroxamate transport system, periplasmic component [Candidatus Nitrososphaera evergladensis SR1]
MRIVSFLPSATETLYELGLGHHIVGVTHECKHPPAARKKPQVIRPSFDPASMSGKEIDSKIVELVRSGGDIYIVDEKALKEADPELIVAQGLCEVCSPFTKEIGRAVSILGGRPDVLVLDPHDLDDVRVSIMDVAEKVGRVKEGRRLVSSLQRRIDAVRALKIKNRPKVACIEWVDPPFTAGHWVPQMVEYAGGTNGLSAAGEQSRRTDLEEISKFDPDIIVMMPCGFGVKRTLEEMKVLKGNAKWESLRAVKQKNVYAVESGAYFSKPSPRTVVGLEILAKIIHPEAARKIKVPKGSYKKVVK